MELSHVNEGFRGDDGVPIEDDTKEKKRNSGNDPSIVGSASGSISTSSLNYDNILDEIGQFGR